MTHAHRSPSRSRLAVALFALLACGAAQADTYTYSGRLEEFGAPASGRYDLKLAVHADAELGNTIVTPIEYSGVDMVDGAFKVDFDLPDGHDEAWVELSIRPAGSADWVALPGRTEAINAPAAIGQCWSTTGDSGSNPAVNFLGTTDAQPLVLRTNNSANLRILPSVGGGSNRPNIVAGAAVNSVAAGVRGATISGGGTPAGEEGDTSEPNSVTANYGTVAGGHSNLAAELASVSGGSRNQATGISSTVSGGVGNRAQVAYSSVGGGFFNTAAGSATVAGGESNSADGGASAVGGGFGNTASGNQSVVAGGSSNTARGPFAAIGGGEFNCAGGAYSWAAGRNASIRRGTGPGSLGAGCTLVATSGDADGDQGTFVWADAQSANFESTGPNQFNIRAQGGVGINTPPRDVNVELTVRGRTGDAFGGNADVQLIVDNANQEGIQFSASNGGTGTNDANFEIAHSNGTVYAPRITLFGTGAVTIRANNTGANTGVTMAANAGSWSSLSDRRVKMAILPVDAGDVLSRVLALPMSTWSYIAQGEAIRHMGPMAQDFRAAFGLGENDTTIATIDADGVALAAIQGLNAKLEAQNAALEARNAELAARITALEAALLGRVRD